METITITEALADIKTIGKRVAKKQEFVGSYLARVEAAKDPHAAHGGSAKVIDSERQSISDLWRRVVTIRTAIADANRAALLSIGDRTMTVAEWIVWRREIAPQIQTWNGALRKGVENARAAAKKNGSTLASTDTGNPQDIIINIDERRLMEEIDSVEQVLGELDGKLSLHNARTTITI